MRRLVLIIVLMVTAASYALAQTSPAPTVTGRTFIYFVRHAEAIRGRDKPNRPLRKKGEARARIFARTVQDIRFSNVFSSHTTRARQTVEAVANRLKLPVIEHPKPGSVINETTVDDRTPATAAIKPLVEALRQLPSGSVALVGVNSDNIYAIMNGLGVPVDEMCSIGSTCVPCLDNSCYPRSEFDRYWILITETGGHAPQLIHLRYGTRRIKKR